MHLALQICRRQPMSGFVDRGFEIIDRIPRVVRIEYTTSTWRRLCIRSNSPASASTVFKVDRSIMDEDAETDTKGRRFPLPPVFLVWLKQNGLDPAIYDAAHDLPRYIRLKPRVEDEILGIEDDLGTKLSKLSWLPGFYSISPEVQIARSKSYQEAKIYGMDAASGAAVAALDISPGDHVLDLCAAPGVWPWKVDPEQKPLTDLELDEPEDFLV